MPVVLVNTMGSGGELLFGATATGGPVITEASAAAILATGLAAEIDLDDIAYMNRNQTVLAWTAAGGAVLDNIDVPWVPFIPQTITADGAGNPAAAAFVPGNPGDLIDVMIWCQNDIVAGANEYVFRFRTDPLAAGGGIVAVNPAWAAVEIPLPVNSITPMNPYGHRMITTVVAEAFGFAEGINGDWPFNAAVTFYGFYRYI